MMCTSKKPEDIEQTKEYVEMMQEALNIFFLMTAHATVDTAVEAMKQGAYD